MSEKINKKQYMPLVGAAGIGSMLGSGIIIGLSATITVWQSGLGLSDGQVGILSGASCRFASCRFCFGSRSSD